MSAARRGRQGRGVLSMGVGLTHGRRFFLGWWVGDDAVDPLFYRLSGAQNAPLRWGGSQTAPNALLALYPPLEPPCYWRVASMASKASRAVSAFNVFSALPSNSDIARRSRKGPAR
jgi:hypothetical protein